MRNHLITFSVFFLAFQNGYGQTYHSTSKFKVEPFESVMISSTVFDNESDSSFILKDSTERASLLIFDKKLKHHSITAKLIEYRDGIKLRETMVLFKEEINRNSSTTSFEDSSCVFALYRKSLGDSLVIWGFKTPSVIHTEKIIMPFTGDYWPYITDLQYGKLPIGKPFVFLIVTTPEALKDQSFFRTNSKTNYKTSTAIKHTWIKHTFIIELTIEKKQKDKKSNQNLRS